MKPGNYCVGIWSTVFITLSVLLSVIYKKRSSNTIINYEQNQNGLYYFHDADLFKLHSIAAPAIHQKNKDITSYINFSGSSAKPRYTFIELCEYWLQMVVESNKETTSDTPKNLVERIQKSKDNIDLMDSNIQHNLNQYSSNLVKQRHEVVYTFITEIINIMMGTFVKIDPQSNKKIYRIADAFFVKDHKYFTSSKFFFLIINDIAMCNQIIARFQYNYKEIPVYFIHLCQLLYLKPYNSNQFTAVNDLLEFFSKSKVLGHGTEFYESLKKSLPIIQAWMDYFTPNLHLSTMITEFRNSYPYLTAEKL